jgi:hypothetical protein
VETALSKAACFQQSTRAWSEWHHLNPEFLMLTMGRTLLGANGWRATYACG